MSEASKQPEKPALVDLGPYGVIRVERDLDSARLQIFGSLPSVPIHLTHLQRLALIEALS